MLCAQAVHIDILTNKILAVLFVTSSKIAPEKCYACCPPLLLDEIYTLAPSTPYWKCNAVPGELPSKFTTPVKVVCVLLPLVFIWARECGELFK